MGVSKKGKRKIMIDGNVYWWFAEEGAGGEPVVHILAADHSFLADCNMYCPVLRITKDSRKGVRDLAIPFDVSDRYAALDVYKRQPISSPILNTLPMRFSL